MGFNSYFIIDRNNVGQDSRVLVTAINPLSALKRESSPFWSYDSYCCLCFVHKVCSKN